MHLGSYRTLLFHGAFLILSCEMPPTGLDEYANTVVHHFHMHYYFGFTAIPPVHSSALWLTFKLWAVLAALRCLHSWDIRSLNCTQQLRLHDTAWKEALKTQPCVKEQHSRPNIHPWSTNGEGLGRGPERQWGTQRYNCRGRRWRTNHHPLLSSLTPSAVDLGLRA